MPNVSANNGQRDNDWKNKPVTRKQGLLLHDMACGIFSELSRGEASELIQYMMRERERRQMIKSRRGSNDLDSPEEI